MTDIKPNVGDPACQANTNRTCEHCRYFSDFRATETDPDEANGYCTYDFITTGFTVNEYGGHWTHHESTCKHWEGGTPFWTKSPANTEAVT